MSMTKDQYIKSLNPGPTKPGKKRSDRRLKLAPAELVKLLDQHASERVDMQDENHALRSELDYLRAKLAAAELDDNSKVQEILNQVRGLTSAVTFHLNANTLAINALSANIANLNVKAQ